MNIRKKILLIFMLLLTNNVVYADYLVYPNGKGARFLVLPEPDEMCARNINNESYWYYKHVQNSYEYNGSNYTSHSFTVDLVYKGAKSSVLIL